MRFRTEGADSSSSPTGIQWACWWLLAAPRVPMISWRRSSGTLAFSSRFPAIRCASSATSTPCVIRTGARPITANRIAIGGFTSRGSETEAFLLPSKPPAA